MTYRWNEGARHKLQHAANYKLGIRICIRVDMNGVVKDK